MIVEIKVPSPGESISEVEIASWLVQDGDYVEKDQEVAEVESDKATLPLIAEQAGKIKIGVWRKKLKDWEWSKSASWSGRLLRRGRPLWELPTIRASGPYV